MNVMAMLGASNAIAAAASRRGLRPCSFRFDGPDARSISRAADGSALVRLPSFLERADDDVVLGMVDGLLAANDRADDWPLRREVLFELMEAQVIGA